MPRSQYLNATLNHDNVSNALCQGSQTQIDPITK